MNMEPSATEAVTQVKGAVTTVSVLNHLKNNRVEVALSIILLHLLGVSDRILANISGVRF